MLQRPSGQVVTGLDFGGSPTTNTSKENGRRMLAEAARFLPELGHAAIDKVTLGW
jgi:hypothetical protein